MTPEPRDTALPRWLLLAAGLLLVWIYTHGCTTNPLKWEEPRRCLVAMEMIHSGNYVVPTVLGEPYLKKPPLQNWLLVLLSGNDASRVGPTTIRAISLLALAGTCLLLWRASGVLAVLVFLTMGAVMQSARAGEIDPPFCFFVTAALAAVEFGRRRGSPWIQWVLSQVLIGAGVLTKLIAPLFFYPPVLFWLWRRRREARFSTVHFILGLLGLAVVVGAWLVPYALQASAGDLREAWTAEVLTRTVRRGWQENLLQPLVYPFLLVLWMLPWSLALFTLGRSSWSELRRRIAGEPWLELAATVVGWGVLVFLFVPEQKGRYLLPIVPFLSVLIAALPAVDRPARGPLRRRWPWLAAAVVWAVAAWIAGQKWLPHAPLSTLLPLVLGLAVLAIFARVQGHLLLALGLLYGVAYAGFVEIREATASAQHVAAAEQVRAGIDDDAPVVCERGVSLRLSYALSHALGRPLSRRAPEGSPAWWVAAAERSGAGPGAPRVEAWHHRLWRVEDTEAWSLLGAPLVAPELAPEVYQDFERKLELAQADHAARPHDVEALIWVGRRTAYLGRHREAVAVYTAGIAEHPDEPRLYRHRGHRWITLRQFDAAIDDLEYAARLVAGKPDEVEPDGLPNAANIPTSTLNSNIWYHLGLAYYLRGDLTRAERCWRECLRFSTNDDMLSATTHWLYMTLRRAGRDDEARELLAPIHAGMRILENQAYHELLLMYRGERTPEELLERTKNEDGGGPDRASLAYGVGNWYLYGGDRERAGEIFAAALENVPWAAFGCIAAEADLERLIARKL